MQQWTNERMPEIPDHILCKHGITEIDGKISKYEKGGS